MFQRQLINKLTLWRNSNNRKPLILRGARQVGKTSLVHLFGQEFEQYIYLNLERPEDRELFEKHPKISDLVQIIFLNAEKNLSDKETLLFIDEIQAYPPAIQLLRYFKEDYPSIHVISAGSLLENVFDIAISFPVGRVTYQAVRPFSFTEFLRACKKDQALELLYQTPTPSFAHNTLLSLFHTYTLIGGMPEVVKAYSKNQDITALSKVYESILIPYLEDVAQYASNSTLATVLQHLIRSSLTAAGNRITFEGFGNSNYKSREVGEALRMLEKTFFLKLIYPVTQVALPLQPSLKKSPRLQVLDTGLVNYFSGIQKDIIGTKDLNSLYRGRITEHIIYQELLTIQENLLHHPHFWVRDKKTSQAEVDIIYPYDGKLIPIEIKSGAAGRLRSLHQFIDQSPQSLGVRLYAGPFMVQETKTIAGKPFTLINLPYYAISQIDKYLTLVSQ